MAEHSEGFHAPAQDEPSSQDAPPEKSKGRVQMPRRVSTLHNRTAGRMAEHPEGLHAPAQDEASSQDANPSKEDWGASGKQL